MTEINHSELTNEPKPETDADLQCSYPHPARKIKVFPTGTKKDLRLPLHVDSANDGKNIAEIRGMSRVLLFTEYIERGLSEDRAKFQSELQDYENKSVGTVHVEVISEIANVETIKEA